MKDILVTVFWIGVVGVFLALLFGSPSHRQLTELQEAVERLQRTVTHHDHHENIEGVWVTDAHTFCEMYDDSMEVDTDPSRDVIDEIFGP